ncbi:hypothetical protein LCGC14_0841390 [marine sediment metagenome]|uniref:Uncharacterized protein n=1 Tax=marine sediment metagenome TaxID=412755 RepID=A0A0F9PY75_9ZZZZ
MAASSEYSLSVIREFLQDFATDGVKLLNDHRFDAFGRWRTSEQQTIAELKLLDDKQPVFWAEKITNASGNATSTHSDASVTMHVESGDTIIRQTRQRWNYQPGKSQLCTYTGKLGLQPAGVTTRIGSFDALNGIFWESTDGVVKVVIRKGGIDTPATQGQWNADTLDPDGDGPNPSGLRLDATKIEIFGIDFQWLGSGTVRFSMDIADEIRIVHKAMHSNILAGPYINSPNLPVRYEISSTGPTAELLQVCASIASEGGQENIGPVFSAVSPTLAVNSGVATAMVGIRLRADRIDVAARQIQKAAVAITQNDNFELYTLLNPTIADGGLDWANYQDSAVQVGVGDAANTVTGGTRIGDTVFGGNRSSSAQSDVVNSIGLGTDVDDAPDEIVVVVEPLQNGSYRASTAWQEAL